MRGVYLVWIERDGLKRPAARDENFSAIPHEFLEQIFI